MEGKFTEFNVTKQELSKMQFFDHLYFDKIGFFQNAYDHNVIRNDADYFIIFFCTKGKGFLKLNNNKFEIAKGDIFFTFPKMRHEYGTDNSDPWSIYWAHFKSKTLNIKNLLSQSKICPENPIFPCKSDNNISNLFDAILKDTENISVAELRYKQSIFAQMLFEILNLVSKPQKKDEFVLYAMNYINEHLSEDLSIDKISEAVGLSKYYLCHKFTKDVGVPIKQYILLKRIKQAKFMLASTDKNISEIAYLCGYNNIYFSNGFKKQTGLAPIEYRKKYKM